MSRSDGEPGPLLAQHLDVRAFLALSLRNGALNLLTLGLYRFWGRSETRRWLWDATDLDGDPLDYSGSGMELLVGFLVRLALIGGALLGAYEAVRVWGGAWGAPGAAAAVAAAAFFHGFSRFAGFVYLANRTEWRGAAFEVEGSPVAFAWRELRDAVLALATLGWWRPRADRAQDAVLWGGLQRAGRPTRFDAAAAGRTPLYSAFAIGWFGTVMILLFGAGVLLGLASGFFPTPDVGRAPTAGQLLALALLALALWLLLRAIWSPYRAARRAAVAAGLGLRAELDRRAAARLDLVNALALILSFGALSPWTQARESAFLFSRLSNPGRPARLPADATCASVRTRDETHAVHAADL